MLNLHLIYKINRELYSHINALISYLPEMTIKIALCPVAACIGRKFASPIGASSHPFGRLSGRRRFIGSISN